MKPLLSLLSHVALTFLFAPIFQSEGSEPLKFNKVSIQTFQSKNGEKPFTVNGILFDQKKIPIKAIEANSFKEEKELLGLSDTIVNGFTLYCRVLKSGNFAFASSKLMAFEDPNVSKELLSFYQKPEYVKNVIAAASKVESIEPILAVLSENGLVYLYARVLSQDYTMVNAVAMKEVNEAWIVVPSILSDEKNKIEMKILDLLTQETKEKTKTIDFEVISSR